MATKKMNSEVARSRIDPRVLLQLWGVAAGRCEMCNKPLSVDPKYGKEVNIAQNAHIHAVSPNGPRHKSEITDTINDADNLMLLCYDHHHLIDNRPEEYGHGVLIDIKRKHEKRIREVTSICDDQKTRIVTYISPVDGYSPEHSMTLFRQAVCAHNSYPGLDEEIVLNLSNIPYETSKEYYNSKSQELDSAYHNKMNAITRDDSISVFGFAPQPLLIKLGTLLSDQNNVHVYQCHRQGHKWIWKGEKGKVFFTKVEPNCWEEKEVAFVIDLSATVNDSRIRDVLGGNIPIFHLSLLNPNRDFVSSPNVQNQFVSEFRSIMNQIKANNPKCEKIHLFPVMPVSLNIRLGMDYMPKADPMLTIYEQDKMVDGFLETITIGG